MSFDFAKIVAAAAKEKSSDIHLHAGQPVLIRRNTILHRMGEAISSAQILTLLKEILTAEQISRFEAERQLDFRAEISGAQLRGNSYFTDSGACAAFRLINSAPPEAKNLGLPEAALDLLLNIKQGLCLIVGPTGHGKTTTLASIVQTRLTDSTEHVITIEDPIEYKLKSTNGVVAQRQVGRDVLSFSNGVKSALREDPDVILVGELRDLETIRTALTMAETGHAVYATLHTNSAAQTVNRIIDLFPPEQQGQIRSQLADSLKIIVSQRLLPNSDGNGMSLAVEILKTTYAVANYIREGKTYQIPNAIQTAADPVMREMEKSLAALVNSGKVKKSVALQWALHPEVLQSLLQKH